MVDWRRHLSGGSEAAIKTGVVVVATRELIRAYETFKGLPVVEGTATGDKSQKGNRYSMKQR